MSGAGWVRFSVWSGNQGSHVRISPMIRGSGTVFADGGHTSPLPPLVCQRARAALSDGQEVSRRAATVWNSSWCGQVLLSRIRMRRVWRSTTAPIRSKVRRMRFGPGHGEHRAFQCQAAQPLDQGIGQS